MQKLYFITLLVTVALAVPAPEVRTEDDVEIDSIGVASSSENDEIITQAIVSTNADGMPVIMPLDKIGEEIQAVNRTVRASSSSNDNSTRNLGGLGPLLSILPGNSLQNTPNCVYSTNCNFLSVDLYVAINILSALACGNEICGGDQRCTHFVYNPNINGGSCYLKSVPQSGGRWATPVTSPSGIVCGHIPKRSCGTGSLINICLDLDIDIL